MYKTNVNEIPFSMKGSYIRIIQPNKRLLIGTVSHLAVTLREHEHWSHDYFEIALYRNGKELDYKYEAMPERIKLIVPDGYMRITFKDTKTLSFDAENVEIKLLPCHLFVNKYLKTNGELLVLDHVGTVSHQFRGEKYTVIKCEASPTINGADGGITVTYSGNKIRGAIRFSYFETVWNEPLGNFEDDLNFMKNELDTWMKKMPQVPDNYQKAAKMAWHINWNCIVNPQGNLNRKAMLMSKQWMNRVWAWDNCFNALATVEADIDLAWDQLFIFFDNQGENGIIPDSVTDLSSVYGYVKPPIYGWTIKKLVQKTGLRKSKKYLEKIYEPVKKLTEWWYTFRDYDNDGVCQYHHGNDSGWDNSTIFDQGYPTEAADLSAHLTLQLEGLAYMAELLGKQAEAEEFKAKSQQQLENLLDHCVKDNKFYSPMDGSHTVEPSQSLLNYVALVLGHRLPEDLRNSVIKDLSPGGPFLTDFGLATESPQSKKYTSNGYWRGPIWAPSTYLIFDGILDAGEVELAKIIAERFCDMCAKEPGMYENYDALTGKGLRCPGYSWTSSVFILLANWLYSIQGED